MVDDRVRFLFVCLVVTYSRLESRNLCKLWVLRKRQLDFCIRGAPPQQELFFSTCSDPNINLLWLLIRIMETFLSIAPAPAEARDSESHGQDEDEAASNSGSNSDNSVRRQVQFFCFLFTSVSTIHEVVVYGTSATTRGTKFHAESFLTRSSWFQFGRKGWRGVFVCFYFRWRRKCGKQNAAYQQYQYIFYFFSRIVLAVLLKSY